MLRKVIKSIIPKGLFRKIEPTGHLLEAIFWQVVMGFPARGLKIAGVTGTDGKTTTSTMIYTILNAAGKKTGLMTTIGYGVPDNWRDNEVHMTTMPTRAMLNRIRELRSEGIEWLVLETTSHALAQNRVWGIPYSVAVMTNLTHEHLDYHGTFERYRDAKVKLFKMTAANSRGLKVGIVNADDPSAPYFAAAVPRAIRYGVKHVQVELLAKSVKITPSGSMYDAKYEDTVLHMATKLAGSFNVYNSLAAAGAALAIGVSTDDIERGIAQLVGVPGRMQAVDMGQNFSLVVDFAHTPDSFEKILGSMRELTKGKLIVMFGSAGRRDEAKRGLQGASAGKWADLVVVTEEDDRDVDGQQIMEQIARGAEKHGKKLDKDLFLVHDRTQAIEFAVSKARKGDTVLLLGKGHEKTIERADGEHPWDELAEAERALKKLSSK